MQGGAEPGRWSGEHRTIGIDCRGGVFWILRGGSRLAAPRAPSGHGLSREPRDAPAEWPARRRGWSTSTAATSSGLSTPWPAALHGDAADLELVIGQVGPGPGPGAVQPLNRRAGGGSRPLRGGARRHRDRCGGRLESGLHTRPAPCSTPTWAGSRSSTRGRAVPTPAFGSCSRWWLPCRAGSSRPRRRPRSPASGAASPSSRSGTAWCGRSRGSTARSSAATWPSARRLRWRHSTEATSPSSTCGRPRR